MECAACVVACVLKQAVNPSCEQLLEGHLHRRHLLNPGQDRLAPLQLLRPNRAPKSTAGTLSYGNREVVAHNSGNGTSGQRAPPALV